MTKTPIRRLAPVLALAAIGLGFGAASAAPPLADDDDPPKPAEVDPEEAKSIWDYLSKRYDADGDGKITLEEYGRGEEYFARLDANGDGSVTSADTTGRRRPGRGGGGGGRGRGGRQDADGQRPSAPQEGDRAPDFTLQVLERAPKEAKKPKKRASDKAGATDKPEKKDEGDEEETALVVQLSDYAKKKPVALIFGSYT